MLTEGVNFHVCRPPDSYVAAHPDFNGSIRAEKRDFLSVFNVSRADAQLFRLSCKQNPVEHQVDVIDSGHMYNALHPSRKSFCFSHWHV